MLCLFVATAFAAESATIAKDTLDIGVLQNSEVKVVQKMLYRKEDKLEIGVGLAVMPFDGYTIAPELGIVAGKHFSESLGAEIRLGGGYGLENAVYTELAGPLYGVAVEAYRYLASAEADLEWTPIYAKMNFGGKKVVHNDVYFLFGAGATVEQSLIPDYDIVISPTVPVGVGSRIYLSKTTFLRAELRDSMLIEHRIQSDTWGFKQNVGLGLGLSVLLGETK